MKYLLLVLLIFALLWIISIGWHNRCKRNHNNSSGNGDSNGSTSSGCNSHDGSCDGGGDGGGD